jgi:hypothetical protein
MMGGLGTIRENLAGAWQVMLGRPEGLNRLDTSLEGFWRSFAAVILVVPFAVLAMLRQEPLAALAGAAPHPLTGRDLVLWGLALLLDWIAFPIVFALIAPPFGLGSRYVPFIVARNWASVIFGAMMGAAHALHLVGVFPTVVAQYVLFAAIAVALRFLYVIVRLTLAVPMSVALPIVMLDFLISLTVGLAFNRVA